MEKGFQKLLICILAKLTTRKKTQALKTCLSSETAEFFSMLVDIVTNNTQYTTKCTNLHPTPTSGDPLAKVNILLYIVLIISLITLKSPLGLPPKNNSTKPFIGFRALIAELQVYAQYSIKMR